MDTPLHSLYVSSRPLDKGRNEDMIIIFRYLSVAYAAIHTHTQKYSDEFKSLICQDIHSGSVCMCVCVCVCS